MKTRNLVTLVVADNKSCGTAWESRIYCNIACIDTHFRQMLMVVVHIIGARGRKRNDGNQKLVQAVRNVHATAAETTTQIS